MTSSSTIAMVLCHGVCARADEPVPTEGSAVNEPAPAPGQPPSKRAQPTTAWRGAGGAPLTTNGNVHARARHGDANIQWEPA